MVNGHVNMFTKIEFVCCLFQVEVVMSMVMSAC